MSDFKHVAALLTLTMLGACGGGDGDASTPGTGGSPTTGAPAAPTLGVSLSPASQTTSLGDDGSGTSLGFTATVAGSTNDAVVPDVQFDRTQLALDGEVARGSDGTYKLRFKPVGTLSPGNYSGSVTFRLCREAACTLVYSGSTQAFAYSMTLRLGDWTTYQRNAAHTGYVRATFDPAALRKSWTWAPATTNRVSTVAAANGLVYVTGQETNGTATLYALASDTGAQRWNYAIGNTTYFSPPAVGNGRVFVTTMTTSSNENPIISVDALTGQYTPPRALFASQWAEFLQPTPYKDGLYMSAGYYGNVVYGFDYSASTGWGTEVQGGIWDGETPAVDDDTVYYYSGNAMELVDRRTGELKASLADPFYQRSFYDYYGAPVLGSMNNVMAYSSQRGASTPSILVNWSLATKAYAWRSATTYSTAPAVGGGRVYLSRANPGELNVLDEATGTLLWGWAPPVDEKMIGNTILTNTLVFVSTNKAIYAIPTQGTNHTPVWSAAGGGEMALAADGTLIVTAAPTDYSYPRTLTAYRLR
jgi:outer membrane protein assembly factor BamB